MKRVSVYYGLRFGLALTILAGCGGLKGENGGETPHTVTPISAGNGETKAAAGVQAALIEGAAPQAFQVRLTWPELAGSADVWTVYRESDQRPRTLLATLDKEKTEFTDSEVHPGERCRYLLEGGNEPRRQVEVTVPRDFEVTGVKSLKKVTGIHRLFLRAGAVLSGEDGSLEIEVAEIHSEGAVLRAFPEKATAPFGYAGRSGQHIVVRAKRGSGLLHVVGTGETGGEGQAGVVGPLGGPGRTGTPFRLDFTAEVKKWGWDKILDVSNSRDLPQVPPGHEKWQHFVCKHPPSAGTPGQIGGKGGPGGVGARGGDAPKVLVRVQNPAGFEVRPIVQGGPGGAGGVGGPGGPGGPGGGPGQRDPGQLCPPGSVGPQGPQGVVGDTGPVGPVGGTSPFCLKLGAAVYGDCASLPEIPPFTD